MAELQKGSAKLGSREAVRLPDLALKPGGALSSHNKRTSMDADEFRNTLRGYLGLELPLEVAATRLAREEVEEGWYLYCNAERGTPEDRALLAARQRRVQELVAAWRQANGESPPPGTA
jgi:hypothetical protein